MKKMKKAKKNKVVIKGFVPVGNTGFYYSRVQDKFVDTADKLYLGDLYNKKGDINPKKIQKNYPLVTIKGIAKIKLTIKL